MSPTSVPKKFQKLPADERQTQCHEPWEHLPTHHPLPESITLALPLKYDHTMFAYTDGSVVDRKSQTTRRASTLDTPPMGSGLYANSAAAGTHEGVDLLLRIQPAIKSYPFDNTINRAELVPVMEAISRGYTHIATDSLSTLYQVKKIAHQPQAMNEHRHLLLHKKIAELILEKNQPIHIYKVKSHIGIVGNEIADELATSVAKGTETPNIHIQDDSNPHESQYWPYHTQDTPDHADAPTRPQPLTDLDASLRKLCHNMYHMGTANTATTYYAAAQKAAALIDMPASNKFLTSRTVTPYETTNVLKLRCGNLYNNKLAHRYGRSTTSKCPLCRQPDGGYHLASGCPALSEAYIERHHATGMYILKAIKGGRLGSTVVQADVGSNDKRTTEGLPDLPTSVPNNILPPSMIAEYEQADNDKPDSRPDITLYWTEKSHGLLKRHYTFVEIKYCVDTKPQEQQANAEEQHKGLIQMIQKHDVNAEVRLVVILLGTAGYIYEDYTKKQLQEYLGVDAHALKSLVTNLHLQSVNPLMAKVLI